MTADARAQRAALFQYAKAHDRFAELEQVEAHQGHPALAADARRFAEIAVRAWLAERDDPAPKDVEA
jgi:hypothetical protein